MSNKFLRRKAVEHRTGLSKSAIYQKIASGEFPKPYKLGLNSRAVAWLEGEIDAWQSGVIAHRPADTVIAHDEEV